MGNATLVHVERSSPIELVDISRHGARVRGTAAYRIGARVELQIHGVHQRFVVPAQVVWTDRSRRRTSGLAFRISCEHEQEMLDRALDELLQPGGSKGDVLVICDDPMTATHLVQAVREAGFCPIEATTPLEISKHQMRGRSQSIVAAFVLTSAPRQDVLAYLSEQMPAVRRIALTSPSDSAEIATALRGAGRYG